VKDRAPIACFALVTKASPESLSFTEKVVIPLVAADLLLGLIGRDLDHLDDDVFFDENSDASAE
jgi:hypothetical protein